MKTHLSPFCACQAIPPHSLAWTQVIKEKAERERIAQKRAAAQAAEQARPTTFAVPLSLGDAFSTHQFALLTTGSPGGGQAGVGGDAPGHCCRGEREACRRTSGGGDCARSPARGGCPRCGCNAGRAAGGAEGAQGGRGGRGAEEQSRGQQAAGRGRSKAAGKVQGGLGSQEGGQAREEGTAQEPVGL